MVLGLLAGCTADWDSSRTSARALALRDSRPEAFDPQAQLPSVPTLGARGARSVASLPDRGELLAYAMPRDRRLAQKSHAAFQVRLSEEHAFNAARKGGRIVVPTPDGGAVTLAYDRHVEHPDGNWSWIGRDGNGNDVVLTFGEKAVFGTIPGSDGESWRLTTAAGQSWLAKVDRNRIAAMGSGKRAATDALVPPPSAVGDASQSESPGAHSNITMVATDGALATTTVDVLVGYTNGLASELGQSEVITRVNYLIDVTNQAYINSGVNAQVRLVGAQQVNYRDDSDNGTALEELSGHTQSGPSTPNPAFASLRAARDALGADLVVLLRDFRTPQNNGCGIAWLIGSGQTGIEQADAPFGYSVVSDGRDVDEGDGQTYFCRDESMAHEMGHNMGQAHNVDNSPNSGVHAYSYGYRESIGNGFYTVMAYALPGANQSSIRYFANPNVNYEGRPTGVANASDNVRSMNAVIPIIASFRQAARAMHDADGDGKSDLYWYNASSAQMNTWIMSGAVYQRSWTQSISNTCSPRGVGDFDGDRRSDLVWTCTNGSVWMWPSNGTSYGLQYVGGFVSGWSLFGVGDTDGDGKADLIWHNPTTAQLNTWIMNGPVYQRSWTQAASTTCTPRAVGDFDGNGKADVAWTCTNGTVWTWPSTGTSYGLEGVGGFIGGWQLVGSGDADGDGKSDLYWYNEASGSLNTWVMNGSSVARSWTQTVSNTCTPRSFGDFDGNGKSDIAWTCANGTIWMWPSDGASYGLQYVGGFIGGWVLTF